MSAVEVEIADEHTADAPRPGVGPGAGPDPSEGKRAKPRREPVEVEIEREITKRQLIQSISTIVVVILYMVFTLLRDRDSGVVVVDPTDEDWDENDA
ncbi:MAG: hypothetical protein ABMA64_17375 [Myxococcota bacterium]